jgi:hypothetical protein
VRALVRDFDALFLGLELACARFMNAVASSRVQGASQLPQGSERERQFLEVFFCQKVVLMSTAIGYAVKYV